MDVPAKIKHNIRDLLFSQKLAVLSTYNKGQPYANLVAFVTDEALKHIYFATPLATRKFKNIKAEPRVAMLIDSRSNLDADFHHAMAVTATGRTKVVKKEAYPHILAMYIAKHPYLEGFVKSPSTELVCIIVKTYYLVKNFQKVTELHVKK